MRPTLHLSKVINIYEVINLSLPMVSGWTPFPLHLSDGTDLLGAGQGRRWPNPSVLGSKWTFQNLG
jgi:hypothetical protein